MSSKPKVLEHEGRLEMDVGGDLPPVEIFFSVKGKWYCLCEVDEGYSIKYRNELTRIARVGSDGKPTSMLGYADTESLLVSYCTFDTTNDGETKGNKRISQEIVKSWGSSVVKKLYQKAREISGFDEVETSEEVIENILEQRKRLSLDETRVLVQKLRETITNPETPMKGQEGNSPDSPEFTESS